MSTGAKILGFGKALPSKVVTNKDLEELFDTTDEWITQRTGIKERRVLDTEKGENATNLAAKAAKSALEQSQKLNPDKSISFEDIDLVICSTATSDNLFPSTACMVLKELGIEAAAFDLSAACSGFVYALNVANGFIKTGQYQNILIVSVDLMSRYVDWGDRRTAIIFGDGAGAAIVSADNKDMLASFHLGAKADADGALCLKNTYSAYPIKASEIQEKPEMVHMDGQAVYQFAVKALPKSIEEACKTISLDPSTLSWVVPHQANMRIISSAAKRLGVSLEKFICNIDRYGNTSSASIPIAFHEAIEDGRIKPSSNGSQKIAIAGFGAGLTWGAAVLDF